MRNKFLKKTILIALSFCIAFSGFFTNISTINAEPTEGEEESSGAPDPYDYYGQAEARKSLPIQSNEIANWPQGPKIGAQGAVLMEANTGIVLYAKNPDEKMYPASTTKILTSLVAIENSNLDEMVKFSHKAVFSIEPGSSNMGMDEGQSIPMEQCLYGILVYSANEVCNAVAEHIAGDMDSYVEMMNQKAAELGCTNSHFVTTNGLHNVEHYTTPRDLATIGCEFFKNSTLTKMSGTPYYHVPQSPTQPDDDVDLYTHNQLTKKKYDYEGYVGGKTGYTTVARQTLVSCAERDGIKLVCVIMKEESPNQFLDTIALFDYGFNNFQRMNISQSEATYTVNQSSIFNSDEDVFFNSEPIIEIDPSSYIIMPNTVSFDMLDSSLSYDKAQTDDSVLASIDYKFQDIYLGSADITITKGTTGTSFIEDMETITQKGSDKEISILYINIIYIVIAVVALLVLVLIIISIVSFVKNYNFNRKRKGPVVRRRRNNRNGRADMWDSWD